MENGRGDRYAYDAEGQLTQASYRALNPEPWLALSDAKRSDSFQYDALGSRYGSNRIASRGIYMDFTRRDNGLNQYHMWSPYSGIFYDDNFNANWQFPGNGVMMADGYFTASYNALNQPVAMGSQGLGNNFYWFWHDPLGRCVKRWLGNGNGVPTGAITYFYYDGWNLVQEGPNASTADRLYVHGGRVDEIVASKQGGQWYHHHYDARGHCLLLTNSTGAIQEQYDYDAFGMPYFYNAAGTSLGNFGGVGNRFLFTGREWIKDLRVYDYRHRMYQPELGRFLQPDPIQFKSGDYNLYRYCHNDPINKADPMGLETAVAIGMGTDDNPLGHVAFATTGQGTLSLGTRTEPGSAFTAYLSSQANYRNTIVYVLPTTPAQEAQIRKALVSEKARPLNDANTDKWKAAGDNCSTRTGGALRAGDVFLPGDTRLPAQLQRGLQDMVQQGEATQYSVPQGSKPE